MKKLVIYEEYKKINFFKKKNSPFIKNLLRTINSKCSADYSGDTCGILAQHQVWKKSNLEKNPVKKILNFFHK